MKNYTIYIAGKITGEDPNECTDKFERAEKLIKQLHPSIIVVNPLKLGLPLDTPREQAMPVCLRSLDKCNAIYMLKDWIDSPGARDEFNHANRNRLALYMEDHRDHYVIADFLHDRLNFNKPINISSEYDSLLKVISEITQEHFSLIETTPKKFILELEDKTCLSGTSGLIHDQLLERRNSAKRKAVECQK